MSLSSLRVWCVAALALVGGFALSGCSTTASDDRLSLATGSIEDDIALGREAHPQILDQYGGAYDDPELARYVDDIGQRLVAVSEYADVPFTFTVLDSDIVNAFALPGGYVYVSRGLLALAEDEAELAGVIGHEIGHVTSRHGAERQGQQVVSAGAAILGGLLGAYLGDEAGAVIGGLAGAGAGALFVGQYSQAQEFESDKLGVRYLARAGYDPDGMADFLEALQTNAQLQSKVTGRSLTSPGFNHFFASHPYTPDRVERARARSDERQATGTERNREQLLAKIDGLVFGQSPDQGYVLGQRFAHPILRFEFEVPEGYDITNTPSAVLARGDDRLFRFDMDRGGYRGDLKSYEAEGWPNMGKLSNLQGLSLRQGYEGAIGFGPIKLGNNRAQAGVAVVRASDNNVYRFILAAGRLDNEHVRELESTIDSFRLLNDADVAKLKPQRIVLARVQPGQTIDDLAAAMEIDSNPREWFVTLNGLDRGRQLQAGDTVKLIKRL